MAERPYHHGNLRSALLDAAERTVRERGVQELSLRELARVWPEGEVTDVRVRPVSLEQVFSKLAATEP